MVQKFESGGVTSLGRWCNKLGRDGRVARVWEPLVRLDPQLLECVVYLYPDAPKAEAREGFGGTGFLVGASTLWGRRSFIVTNRHVIEAGSYTISLNTRDGSTAVVETDERDWQFHSDGNFDVAVHIIEHLPHYSLLHIPLEMLLSRNDVDALDLRLGDNVALVGRHINLDGRQKNTPTARFGHLAQLPGERIKDDKGRAQAVFLAQVHSLPGASGSPVFLIQDMVEKNMEQRRLVFGNTNPVWLLGINCGHIGEPSLVFSGASPVRDMESHGNTGITRVLPAWIVDEVIRDAISKLPRPPSPLLTGGFGFGLKA